MLSTDLPDVAARSLVFRSALGVLNSEYHNFLESRDRTDVRRYERQWSFTLDRMQGVRKTVDSIMLMVDRFAPGESCGFWARFREIEQAMVDDFVSVVAEQGLPADLHPYVMPDIVSMAKRDDAEDRGIAAEQEYERRREAYGSGYRAAY